MVNIKVSPSAIDIHAGAGHLYNACISTGYLAFTGDNGQPTVDGQVFSLENVAGQGFLVCSSNATVANSACGVGYGADWQGYSDNYVTKIYDSNGSSGYLQNTGLAESAGVALSTATFTGTNYLVMSATKPTYASGFSTPAPTIVAGGTAAFLVTLGATPGTMGVLNMPAAATGWNCGVQDRTTSGATIRETATTTGSVTFALASAVGGDVLQFECLGY